jgi:hypothetical protein
LTQLLSQNIKELEMMKAKEDMLKCPLRGGKESKQHSLNYSSMIDSQQESQPEESNPIQRRGKQVHIDADKIVCANTALFAAELSLRVVSEEAYSIKPQQLSASEGRGGLKRY